MSNKRITDLTELTTPTTDDVFPVVDIATNTTTKVQLGNLPTTTAVTTALATKQDTLVSGTNIKTVNSTSLVGSGNVAVQPTLVSGTNIKTLNSTSLLGSGDIVLTANPSGVAGAIQFSNGSAFASDAANLFWDDTNNRLGVGTNAPTRQVELVGSVASPAYLALRYGTATGGGPVLALDAGSAGLNYLIISTTSSNGSVGANGLGIFDGTDYRFVIKGGNVGIGETTPTSRLHIKGSGSTSATTSLLVQNSAGTQLLKVADNGLGITINSPTTHTVTYGATGNGDIAISSSALGSIITSNGQADYTFSQWGANLKLRVGSGGAPDRIGYNFESYAGFSTGNANGGDFRFFSSLSGTAGSSTPNSFVEIVTFKFNSSVGINNPTPNASAQLDVASTTRGFLPPRMTTTQKNAIATPAAGLVVYDSTTNKLCCYNGSTWNDLF